MKIFSRLRSAYVFIPFLMICSMQVAPVLAANSDEDKKYWDLSDYQQKVSELYNHGFARFSIAENGINACRDIIQEVSPKLKKARPVLNYDRGTPIFKDTFNKIVNLLQSFEQYIVINNEESYTVVRQWYAFLSLNLKSAFFRNIELRHEQFDNYLSSLQTKIQAYGVQLQEIAVQQQFSIVSENVIHINKCLEDINQFVSSNGRVTKEQMHFLLVEFPSLQHVFNQSINPFVNESEQINSFTRIRNNERVKMVNDSTSLLNHIRSLFNSVIQDGYDSAIPENKNRLLVVLNEGFQNIDFIKDLIIREFTERINQFIGDRKPIIFLSGTSNPQDEAENVKNFIVEVISMLYSHGKNRPGLDIDGVITEIINYCAQMFFTIDRSAFLTVRNTLINAIIQLTYKLSREGAKLDNVIITYPAPMPKQMAKNSDRPSVYPPPLKENYPAPMLKSQNQDDKKSDSLTGFPPPPPAPTLKSQNPIEKPHVVFDLNNIKDKVPSEPTPKPVLIDVPQEKVSKDEKDQNSFFTAGQQGAKSACLLI